MKPLLFLTTFILLFSFTTDKEYIVSDNFKFKFIKAQKARGLNYGYTIKTSKECKRVQIRFKMKSLSGENDDFDPNKFYLISEDDKTRLMPVDVRYNYAAGWIFVPFNYLVDYKVTDKKLKQWLSYNPTVKNTFFDYTIDGYKDICPSINFGTRRKPKRKTPYFDHEELKSCKVDVYFSLPKTNKNIKIFYGDVLLKEAILKK